MSFSEWPRAGRKRLDLMGLPVDFVSAQDLLAFIQSTIRENRKAILLHLNIHNATLVRKHPGLQEIFKRGSVVFCDGEGVRWGLRILGSVPPPKVGLTRWIWDLADFCAQHRLRLFLLGAKPGVAEEAGKKLQAAYPALSIAGVRHGYFKKEGRENEQVVAEINRVRPDLVIIGFGTPIQERWADENSEKLNAHVLIPAGGVLDYAAGRLGKVPSWMIRFHLEWLFRIREEPGRLLGRYGTEIPSFFCSVLWERVKRFFISPRFRTEPRGSSSEKS